MAHSPERIKLARFRAVSWRPWEKRTSRAAVGLSVDRGGQGPARPCGGGWGAWGRRGLGRAPVWGFVRSYAIVSPVWTWAGGAGGVGTGGFALAALTLATGFSLVVAVGCKETDS